MTAFTSIDSFWTDQRVQQLRDLFGRGKSNNQIASEMGIRSRNVVIGKLHRLGLRRETVRGAGITGTAARAPHPPGAGAAGWDRGARAAPAWRGSRTSSTHVTKRVNEIKAKPAPVEIPMKPAPLPVSSSGDRPSAPSRSRVGLFEASPSQCRWPAADDGTAAMVCGAPKFNNQSYCAEHCRIAFLPPLQRRRVA